MSYALKQRESIEDGIRRVVREQIDSSISEILDKNVDRHEAVHQIRKRCKKIRGVLRLVRPAIGRTYRLENTFFRDIARDLSNIRDAQALIETFDSVMEHQEKSNGHESFGDIRNVLLSRRERISDSDDRLNKRLEDVLQAMRRARERVNAWKIEGKGSQALVGGLIKTYRRGRKALRKAVSEPSDENLHDWRKRAKYYWYHMRLLRPAWDPMLSAWEAEARVLSDYLGDDHNIAVFEHMVSAEADDFPDGDALVAFLQVAATRRKELQGAAYRLGRRMYAESPKEFGKRLGTYWAAWHADNDSRAPADPADAETVAAKA